MHVLVNKGSFKAARKLYSAKLSQWSLCLPEEITSLIPPDFPDPQIYQKRGYSDEESSAGQASYMSSCAQSYGSLGDTGGTYDDKQYFHPPGQSPTTLYADALTGNRSSATKSPPMAPPLPTPVDITAYRKEIADLQAEVTIAKLRAEIKALQTQVQAQTPSTVTEASTPGSLPTPDPNLDRMSTIEAGMATLNVDLAKWMKEARHLLQSVPKHGPVTQPAPQHQPQPKRPGAHNDTPLFPHPLLILLAIATIPLNGLILDALLIAVIPC